jgi:hypothetical protein
VEEEVDTLKARAEDYEPTAFYFVQTSESAGNRVVAWTPDPAQMKELFYAAVGEFDEGVRLLFKTTDPDADGEKEWSRYYSECERKEFIEVVQKFEDVVFSDGFNQLCVRELDYSDYIALDEHSILYFYSDNAAFPAICERLGFEKRFESLISSRPHFQREIDDLHSRRKKFIQELRFELIESDASVQ